MGSRAMFEGEIVRPHAHESISGRVNWDLVPAYVPKSSFADEERVLRRVLQAAHSNYVPSERDVIEFAYIRYRRSLK